MSTPPQNGGVVTVSNSAVHSSSLTTNVNTETVTNSTNAGTAAAQPAGTSSSASASGAAQVWSKLRGGVAGMASGITKLVVGHPFDTIKVRMQTEGGLGRFRGPLHCFVTTIKTEGVRGVYKGASPPLVGWTLIDSLMWATLIEARKQLTAYNASVAISGSSTALSLPQHMLAGFVAGLASTIVVTPVEQVKARLQIQYADPTSQRYKGPIDCVSQLVRNNGLLGLYKGFAGTVLFRSFMSVYFGSYEVYKEAFSSGRLFSASLHPSPVNFLSGGLAATTLWVVSFPADTLKNRMMGQPDVVPRRYETLRQCARDLYHEEGLKTFYRGFTPCLLRSFPTNGAAFLMAELALKHLPQ